jgi:hypothetical protein
MEISINLKEPIKTWLEEISENQDMEPKKFAFKKLREFVENTRSSVLTLEADRPIILKDGSVKITKNDLVMPQIVDGGNFVIDLGKLLSERLPKAVALVDAITRASNMNKNWNTLNDWIEEYLTAIIISLKTEMDNKEMKQEEEGLCSKN